MTEGLRNCQKLKLVGILAIEKQMHFTMTNSNVSSPSLFPILLKASRLTLSLLLVVLATTTARAQDPDEVVRTNVSLVQLNIGVVDKDGRAVTSTVETGYHPLS